MIKLSFDAWDAIAGFIQAPRRTGEEWLREKGSYPESRALER